MRDELVRRAAGGEHSGAYMRELAEAVKICAAVAMHAFILGAILILMAAILGCAHIPPTYYLVRWILIGLLGGSVILWLVYIPRLHDKDEYNVPVFVISMFALGPLLGIAYKVVRGCASQTSAGERAAVTPAAVGEGDPVRDPNAQHSKAYCKNNSTSQSSNCGALWCLAIGLAALAISYFSAFAWSEYRENYFETAFVLGSGTSWSPETIKTPGQ